jgi:DNA-binding phage protein
MTPDGQLICARLRKAIIKTGWSETARRVGMDRTALHRAFAPHRGNRTPSFVTISLVAQALGLKLTVYERRRP